MKESLDLLTVTGEGSGSIHPAQTIHVHGNVVSPGFHLPSQLRKAGQDLQKVLSVLPQSLP